MARARNIKPQFFQNEDLGELCPLTRLLFIGLWTECDYKGCMEYRPKRLKVRLLPWDECSIEQLAINLEKSGFISIYSVSGQQYLKVHNFEKHQNPHKNERDKGSEIPGIEQADFVGHENFNNNKDLQNIEINRDKNGTDRDQDGTDRADSFNLIPSYLNPDSSNLIPDFNTAPQSVASEEVVVEALPTVLPKPKQVKKSDNTEKPTTKVWEAYSQAYWNRHGITPVRNAKVNSQIKQLWQRLGEEAASVAEFYVLNVNDLYVVRNLHDLGTLLAKAETYRTQWATGRTMTQTRARQIDSTQANASAADEAIAMLRAREQGVYHP